MKKNILKLTVQEFNSLFAHVGSSPNEFLWIRAYNNAKQLYIHPNYEKIWGSDCSTLYEHPDSWKDRLIEVDLKTIMPAMYERIDGFSNITCYRVIDTEGSVQYIKDLSVNIVDEHNNRIAFAGVCRKQPAEEWEQEMQHITKGYKDTSCDKHNSHFMDILEKEQKHLSCLLLNQKKFSVQTNEGTVTINKREAQCLYFLIQGYVGRVIGEMIHLSPRTVEDYITRLKVKLNCRTRIEILSKVLNFEAIRAWEF